MISPSGAHKKAEPSQPGLEVPFIYSIVYWLSTIHLAAYETSTVLLILCFGRRLCQT